MNLKTLRTLAITSTVLAGVAALGASGIYAAAPIAQEQSQTNPMSSLVTAIAQKFNLNVSDVQKVFDEQRTQLETQRGTEQTTRMTERLTQAVTSGKLTQAQANLIKVKQEELRTFHESLKGKTREECKTAMDAKMAELTQWAKANNIPEEYVRFGPMGGPGGRMGGPGGQMGPGNQQNQEDGDVNQRSFGQRGPGRGPRGFVGGQGRQQGQGQLPQGGQAGQNNN